MKLKVYTLIVMHNNKDASIMVVAPSLVHAKKLAAKKLKLDLKKCKVHIHYSDTLKQHNIDARDSENKTFSNKIQTHIIWNKF